MTNLHFQKIPIDEKVNFKTHLLTYLQELGITNTEYPYLDSYWIDKNRTPLYFFVGKRKIGFALINDCCLEQKTEPTYSIAEFYIFEKERRNQFGKKLAFQVFDFFKGNWEVRTMKGNKKSELFWGNVIADYAPNFSEISNHPDWKGIIFCFKNKPI
ncbi:MAG: GNAT family N-acetyltransferase [Saprospiraceae bacterium]